MLEKFNDFLFLADSYFGGSQWFVFLLLGTGFFFTIYLKFPQIRYFKQAVRILNGKYDQTHHVGDTSHFQALTTALSGTVGTGNIAGVALAIHLGGPSALFWMLITAFLGMTTKMVEVTLSHKYREQATDKTISGGPMYYMKKRLNMPWMAILFALATILSSFGTGNLPQINSISNAMYSSFGIQHYLTGGILAILLGMIILGGIKRIAQVSEKLVPFMAIIYIAGTISIIAYNYENIIPSFVSIFTHAFNGTAATGGFLGATIAWAFNRGVNRGLFSNEAGQGSAPIAHAAARAEEPVSEGIVALLEPFIDTIIICTLTGLALLTSGVWTEKFDNQFQYTDIEILNHRYKESDANDKLMVSNHINGIEPLTLFNGKLPVKDGKIENAPTILHSRSFADDVVVKRNGQLYTGSIHVKNGKVNTKLFDSKNDIRVSGKSIIHSAPLSTQAFKKGFLKEWGQYIIPISLLLFAFTTSVAWAYYGSRAVIYLWGAKYVKFYYVIYIVGFFIASFTDTSIVWAFSCVTVPLMTLPNLIGIVLLHKEVKQTINKYDSDFIQNNKE